MFSCSPPFPLHSLATTLLLRSKHEMDGVSLFFLVGHLPHTLCEPPPPSLAQNASRRGFHLSLPTASLAQNASRRGFNLSLPTASLAPNVSWRGLPISCCCPPLAPSTRRRGPLLPVLPHPRLRCEWVGFPSLFTPPTPPPPLPQA